LIAMSNPSLTHFLEESEDVSLAISFSFQQLS